MTPAAHAPSPAKHPRRHDLDWLRILAFGLLIFFHSAVLFLRGGIPDIQNSEPSPALAAFVAFSHQFRLSLLFMVSGMGVAFALKRRSGLQYIAERSRRLLIPLAFGVVAVVPPMIYLERLYHGRFDGSFAEFYPLFFTEGIYPEGHLSWHHFWFLAYLYLFCLLSWPLFRYWRDGRGRERAQALAAWATRGGNIYALCVPLILVEFTLRPIFPGFRDLVSDWASFTHWFVVFIAGYVLAMHPALLDRCRDLRYLSLGLALAGSSLLFHLYYDYQAMTFILPQEITLPGAVRFAGFSIIRIVAIWAWLLTCTGFAARNLNWPSRTLAYLNGAVYPLFCLHLTLIVALGFVILPLDLPIMMKYGLITGGTFIGAFALYEGLVKRVAFLRMVLGAKAPATRRAVS